MEGFFLPFLDAFFLVERPLVFLATVFLVVAIIWLLKVGRPSRGMAALPLGTLSGNAKSEVSWKASPNPPRALVTSRSSVDHFTED